MTEEKNKSIFHMENEDAAHSHEKLNEYIRIGSAGGYILIAALIIIAAAVIIWGFTGKIPVTCREYGVVSGPACMDAQVSAPRWQLLFMLLMTNGIIKELFTRFRKSRKAMIRSFQDGLTEKPG